jgi:hypothetical protein
MNRNLRVAAVAAAAWFASGQLQAQSTHVYTPRVQALEMENPNAPRIGVLLGENSLRDTLGVLVNSAVEGGPAAKAGIREGDRIQSIGGVNLRMTRDDAGDEALSGMMARRLVRELDKLEPGDDVELRVYSAGESRTVSIKTVAARELATASPAIARLPLVQQFRDDRAALGLNTGGPVTKRDTLGVFVMSVTPDGPAEKAGIVEGDRIAEINGTDLRVPPEEAGDADLSRARSRRLNQEIARLAAGDAVTLKVVSAGRSRDVKVTAAKASELNEDNAFSFFFDGHGTLPGFDRFRVQPKIELRTLPRGGTYYFDGGRIRADVREQIDKAMKDAGSRMERADVREHVERVMEEARKALVKARMDGDTYYYRADGRDSEEVRAKVERAMEKARDAMEKAGLRKIERRK